MPLKEYKCSEVVLVLVCVSCCKQSTVICALIAWKSHAIVIHQPVYVYLCRITLCNAVTPPFISLVVPCSLSVL